MSGNASCFISSTYPIFHLTIEWMNEKSSGENHMELTSGWGEGESQIAKLQAWKIDMYAGMCTYLLPFLHVYRTNTYAKVVSFSGMQKWKIQFCKKKEIALYANFTRCCQFKHFFFVRSGLKEGWMKGNEESGKLREKLGWIERMDGEVMWLFMINLLLLI